MSMVSRIDAILCDIVRGRRRAFGYWSHTQWCASGRRTLSECKWNQVQTANLSKGFNPGAFVVHVPPGCTSTTQRSHGKSNHMVWYGHRSDSLRGSSRELSNKGFGNGTTAIRVKRFLPAEIPRSDLSEKEKLLLQAAAQRWGSGVSERKA